MSKNNPAAADIRYEVITQETPEGDLIIPPSVVASESGAGQWSSWDKQNGLESPATAG